MTPRGVKHHHLESAKHLAERDTAERKRSLLMFENKVVLVTGGGSGMGRASALRFAELGARVAVADLRGPAAQEVVDEIGDRAMALTMDVGRSSSVNAAITEVVARFGQLDVVVNNAGMLMPGTAVALEESDWDRAFDVNVKSVYLVSRAAWSHLAATKGNIVNLGSINATVGMEGNIAYCTAKAAVVMMTKCLALDGARDGIRVNTVCPGWIRTPMTDGYFDSQTDPDAARAVVAGKTPLGRLGRPGDIANAIVYLASDAAEWVTGTALVADGGITAGVWNG